MLRMDKTEREETTDYASKRIKSLLGDDEHISALLLASIYVNIRLKSLLTNRLTPPKSRWKETWQTLDSLYGFKKMVSLCDKLGLLPNRPEMPRKIKKLWDKRVRLSTNQNCGRDLKKETKQK